MAEGTNNNTNPNTDPTPTVAELQAQLAEMTADRDRFKSANDKLSKSEADMKKQLREKMSAEEKAAEERAEAQRKSDEEREAMRKEINQMKAEKAYKNISDEKAVKKLIDAVSKADHDTIAEVMKTEIEAAVKKAEAEWLNGRPEVNVGTNGVQMTREQILKIEDDDERERLIEENAHLFVKR